MQMPAQQYNSTCNLPVKLVACYASARTTDGTGGIVFVLSVRLWVHACVRIEAFPTCLQERGQSIMFGGFESQAWRAREREPITGVWGRSPQRGRGAEPLVRGRKPF